MSIHIGNTYGEQSSYNRIDDLQRAIAPALRKDVHEGHRWQCAINVLHPFSHKQIVADVLFLEPSLEQRTFENKATVMNQDGTTKWDPTFIVLNWYSAWGFYYKVLEEEDVLIDIARIFSENESLHQTYAMVGIYSQNRFYRVCDLVENTCDYRIVAFFHKTVELNKDATQSPSFSYGVKERDCF